MHTLHIATVISMLTIAAPAAGQSIPLTDIDSTIAFDLRSYERPRVQLQPEVVKKSKENNRHDFLEQLSQDHENSCVLYREWTTIAPFERCTYRSLRGRRALLRFMYVF